MIELANRYTSLDRLPPVNGHDPVRSQVAEMTTRMLSAYEATVSSRFRKISKSQYSADQDNIKALPELRQISRQLYRNDRYARAIVDHMVSNEVGPGIGWQSMIDPEDVPFSDEETARIGKAIEKYITEWSRSKRCDLTRQSSFTALQRQMRWNAIVNGESIVVIRRERWRDGSRRIRLQHIEPDRLDTPLGTKENGGREIRGGVEVNQWGEPVAYWILKHHPGDNFGKRASFSRNKEQFDRVPAYDSRGNLQVLHHFIAERPGQTRGVPQLAPILDALVNIKDYLEAEIIAAHISACIALYLKTTQDIGVGWRGPDGSTQETNSVGDPIVKLQPGAVFSGNEEPHLLNPQRPGSTFKPFITFLLESLGAGTGLASFTISKSFEGINYSSGRLGLLPERRMSDAKTDQLIEDMLRPIYPMLAEEAFLLDRLPISSPSQFYPYFEDLTASRWNPTPHDWVDPEKEVNARILAVDNCLSTLSQEGRGDWEENIRQRGKEERLKDKEGARNPDNQSATPGAAVDEAGNRARGEEPDDD